MARRTWVRYNLKTPEMQVDICLATADDLDLILPLVGAYHELEQIDSTATGRESAVQQLLADSTLGGIWLIRVDDEPAGYIALCRGYSIEFGGFDAFIDELYLEPMFRGRGLGKSVLERIQQEAATLGIRALHLEVSRDHTWARKLYSSAGFQAREKYVLMSIELDRDRA